MPLYQDQGGTAVPLTTESKTYVERVSEGEDEAFAAGVHSGGQDMAYRLNLKRMAVESLSEPSRRYLHINILGIPLPSWMKWEKQPKLNRWNYLMSRLFRVMSDGNSSTLAMWISNFMVFTIIVSVASFCLETVPLFGEDRTPAAAKAFTWIEGVTIQIFAIDYLLRFISSPDKIKFVVEPFNIIDLIAIVPWYVITWVGTDFNGTTVFRVVRLFRVFRVLKLGGRYSKLLVVLHALRKSVDMLGLMIFFISLCIVFFATLMYYAERGSWDAQLGYYVRPNEVQFIDYDVPRPSPFESIVSGFWWAIVTLMTVGYGDIFPITAAGKFIACVAMICGILSLALPISVIGTTFSNDWAAHGEAEKHRVTGTKVTTTTSPPLLQLQRLLMNHVEDIDTLVELNASSEDALSTASSKLHSTLKTTKKHLHTEAKADLRLRRVAKRTRTDNSAYDQQYGFLSMEHVKERYREQLPSMASAAQSLGTRACHVTRMEAVNAHMLDPELEATVVRLSKKHADLAFLLGKFEEKPSPLSLLEAELRDLQGYVLDLQRAAGVGTGAPKGFRARDLASGPSSLAAGSHV